MNRSSMVGWASRPASHLVHGVLALAVVALVPTWCEEAGASESVEAPGVAASYRARVGVGRLESWQAFRAAAGTGPGTIEELVLLEALADQALDQGIDAEPRVRVRLELADVERSWSALLSEVLGPVQPDPDEVRSLASRLRPLPRRVRLRNLFKRYPPEATEAERTAVRRRMEELEQSIRSGADFSELARRESESQSRFRGGLIGNVRAGQLRPEVEVVVLGLSEGQTSPILESPEGLTLLHCERILEAVSRTPEELWAMAEARLLNRDRQVAQEQLASELLAAADLQLTWPVDSSASSRVEVARWVGGRVTSEKLALASGMTVDALLALDRDGVLERVEKLVSRDMAQLRLRRLGLDDRVARDRHWARRQILAGEALAALVRERFEPISEDQLRARFEVDRGLYQRPAEYDLELIQLPLDEADPRASHDAAERLAYEILGGALDFTAAARRHSMHASRAEGGRLADPWPLWRVRERLGREVARAVQSLDSGELTGPIEDGGALWIVRVRSIAEARPMTFEEARAAVDQRVGQEQTRRIEAEVTSQLWSSLAVRDGAGHPLE